MKNAAFGVVCGVFAMMMYKRAYDKGVKDGFEICTELMKICVKKTTEE